MKNFKSFVLRLINSLPVDFKWKIYFLPLFSKRLRIDFTSSRRKILNEFSKIIVIGANDGVSFDDLLDDIHPQKTEGVFLEPSKRYFKRLTENLEKFPKLKVLNIAISGVESKFSLFQLNEKGLKKMPDWGKGIGSFSKDHLLKFDKVTEFDLEEETVDGKPFSWLVKEFNLNSVDYLQIDTEGFDAEIIKMIDFDNFSTKILKFEIANLLEREIFEVKNILGEKGYFLQRIKGDMVAYSKDVNPLFY